MKSESSVNFISITTPIRQIMFIFLFGSKKNAILMASLRSRAGICRQFREFSEANEFDPLNMKHVSITM